jgi:hypothetical protein
MTTAALTRKGLNSLIILGVWILWNHCNRCVFDAAAPSMVESLILLGNERRIWMMAGERGLPFDGPLHRSLGLVPFWLICLLAKGANVKVI